MAEVKIEGYRVIFCICDGEGRGEWKLHQKVRMAVFIPVRFLELFDSFDESIKSEYTILGFKIHSRWGYVVEEVNDSKKYKDCSECPLAPRDEPYQYRTKWKTFSDDQVFNEFVRKTMEEIQRAYEFYKSLPTFRQKQVEIDIVTKITITPTRDRVEILVEILAEELKKFSEEELARQNPS